MDEGLVQIVFILIVVFASVFDAVARKGRARRRSAPPSEEEPVAASGEEEVEWGGEEPAARSSAPTGMDADTLGPGGASARGGRETADSMVPDDLWAVLTGQKPASTSPRPQSTTGAAEGAAGQELEPAPTWEEQSRSLPASRAPRPAPDQRAMPVRRSAEATPRRPVPAARGAVVSSPGLFHHRTRRAGKASRLLAHGQPKELRRAVILTEVLGPPVALRGLHFSPAHLPQDRV